MAVKNEGPVEKVDCSNSGPLSVFDTEVYFLASRVGIGEPDLVPTDPTELEFLRGFVPDAIGGHSNVGYLSVPRI